MTLATDAFKTGHILTITQRLVRPIVIKHLGLRPTLFSMAFLVTGLVA